MRMAIASLVSIDACRHVVQICRFNARVAVLMTSSAQIGLFRMLSNDVKLTDDNWHGKGRRYRP